MNRITRTFVNPCPVIAKYSEPDAAYSDDGGCTWRWSVNDAVIAVNVCKDYGIPCDPAAQQVARDAHVDAVLTAYIRSQPPLPSAEQVAEARAAHGPGVVLVDVVSGRKFTT